MISSRERTLASVASTTAMALRHILSCNIEGLYLFTNNHEQLWFTGSNQGTHWVIKKVFPGPNPDVVSISEIPKMFLQYEGIITFDEINDAIKAKIDDRQVISMFEKHCYVIETKQQNP